MGSPDLPDPPPITNEVELDRAHKCLQWAELALARVSMTPERAQDVLLYAERTQARIDEHMEAKIEKSLTENVKWHEAIVRRERLGVALCDGVRFGAAATAIAWLALWFGGFLGADTAIGGALVLPGVAIVAVQERRQRMPALLRAVSSLAQAEGDLTRFRAGDRHWFDEAKGDDDGVRAIQQ